LQHLETVPVAPDPHDAPLRFPVQYVIRPRTAEHPDYRGYAGQLASGTVHVGQTIAVHPTGHRTTVIGIDSPRGPVTEARAGQSITLLLSDDLDITRGDLITADTAAPVSRDEFQSTLCWLAETPLTPNTKVLLKHGTRTVTALATALTTRFDEQNLRSVEAPESLNINEIGVVTLRTAEPLPIDDYTTNRRSGSFLVIHPTTGDTLAAGLSGHPAWLTPEPNLVTV
jgi:sulfate adenylyltransferase subunit 1